MRQIERATPAFRLRPQRATPPGELRMPIYVQLVTLFRRLIDSGEWAIGRQIPTLDRLTADLGVARATVRHALGYLEREGLIGRYRGRGTFVMRRPDVEVWHDIPTDWPQLVGRQADIRHEWLECRPAEAPPTPSHSGGRLAPAYQYMSRLHRRNGVPYLIGRAHVEAALYREIGRKGFDNPMPYRTIHRHLGLRIGRAEQTLMVSAANMEDAHLLGIALNAPIVVAYRSIFDREGLLVHESEGAYRGDFVRVRMRLK